MKVYATGVIYEINDNNTFNARVYYEDSDEEWWEEIQESAIISDTKHLYKEGIEFELLINDTKDKIHIKLLEPHLFTQEELDEIKRKATEYSEYFKDVFK